MTMTYHLRFPSESAGMQALREEGFVSQDENGNDFILSASHNHAIDIVGIIYNEDWELDPETLEVAKPATAIEGWHINYIGSLPSSWEQYLVTPKTPRRVFFGVD